jgi:hypothetical protein
MPVNNLPQSVVGYADHFYVKGVKDPIIVSAQFIDIFEHIFNFAALICKVGVYALE